VKRISDRIADWLVEHSIEQVFSVTGGGAMFLNQALGSHTGLSCTFMHHEQACAMAAEGYARITGKPAVVMLTTGPGVINALNGVYGAFTDSIPMIVISGQIKRETCLSFTDAPELRQLGDQEAPTIAMVSPVCKYSKIIRSEKDLETILPEAYIAAITGRPGPVWLDIPLDIQQSTAEINIPPPTFQKNSNLDTLRIQCHVLIDRLIKSDRPVILAGTGVRLAGVENRLLALIEKINIPMATAWTHDLIPSNHPLYAGRPGTIGTRAGNFCVQASDFLLVLGSRLNIRQISYNWASFAKNAFVVQVDIDRAELKKPTRIPDLGIEADLGDFLDVMEYEISKAKIPDYSNWVRWCQKIGSTYSAASEHKQVLNQPINPYVLVDRIFKRMRSDDIVVCGNASACILPFQIGSLEKNQRLFSNSGSASMGYDLPAALGAASAAKKDINKRRRVICFAGDGSLQMNIQELQTLKTLNLNIIILVLNNGGYLSIAQTHQNFFGRIIGATNESGVGFPDFVAIARAYGLRAESINIESELTRLDNLLESDGPLLVTVQVDTKQEFIPRLKSRIDENGQFITPELDDMYPFLEKEVLDMIRQEAASIKSSTRRPKWESYEI
jgi:acetolactate synthase-1/2/3 large subunit